LIDENKNNRLASDEEILKAARGVLNIQSTLDIRIAEVKNNTLKMALIPSRWREFDNFLSISKASWRELKYYADDGSVNTDLSTIPNDKGGIYVYVVKTGLPLNYSEIIMYVGRAQNNEDTQNLRKRVMHYSSEAKDIYRGRKSIRDLFNKYKEYLYVDYLPLEHNEDIEKLEKEIIAGIVPPFNDDVIQKSLKEGKKMFA